MLLIQYQYSKMYLQTFWLLVKLCFGSKTPVFCPQNNVLGSFFFNLQSFFNFLSLKKNRSTRFRSEKSSFPMYSDRESRELYKYIWWQKCSNIILNKFNLRVLIGRWHKYAFWAEPVIGPAFPACLARFLRFNILKEKTWKRRFTWSINK